MSPLVDRTLVTDAVESSSAGVMITDGNAKDPRIVYVNPAWERLTGYGRDEVLGQNPRLLQGPETDPAEIDRLRRALSSGRSFAGRTFNYRKDGAAFVMEWTIDPVRGVDGGIDYFVSVQRDATDGANRDRVLEQSIGERQAVRITQSLLMSNMSHELRTPLNAVIGYSDLMLNQPFGEVPQKYLDFLAEIRDGGRTLLELVNNVLTVADARQRKLDLDPSRVCACQLVSDAMAFHAARAASRGLRLDKVHDSEHIHLLGDRYRLTQAVSAIVSNAVKFSPPDETIVVTVGLNSTGDLSITVADRGDGIDPTEMERLFEPFIQGDQDLDRTFDGSGVGLPLARILMELHGGSVAMERRQGGGTTVTLTVPADRILSVGTSCGAESTPLAVAG